MIACVSETSEGAILNVRVIPRARRAAVDGIRGGSAVIRLTSAPVDGRANQALVALLSALLGLPHRSIRLLSGTRSRDKRLLIVGLPARDVAARLSAACDPSAAGPR
jgi:uncharacterized protein (TIGR00251 family)